MIYQQLSGEQLPDIIKLSVAVNGLKGSVKDFVLLSLDGDSSFGDLDTLLAIYVSMHVPHEASLDSLSDRACRDKPEETCFKQEGEQKSKPTKGKGEAYPPQPSAYKGKGKQAQLPTKEQWCNICWKKRHRTQACWWNSNQQHQQQHLQHQAWYSTNKQQRTTAEASQKRSHNSVYKTDKPVACSLANQLASSLEHKTPAASFEHQAQATIQPAFTTPTYTIAQMDSFEHASSTTEAWGILVDTGAATSFAPRSFASDIELSPTPSTLQLTTATGKAIKTYGLRQVHLQSRGLSLEVSFVIADVVTPLLGLDVMIKESLSLHVERDSQQVLANPAGDKTELEHMGRHLYMIACPSQHGLSQCFIGNLSQVIGFLPADKKLYEQSLASRSSSALILIKTQASKWSKTA